MLHIIKLIWMHSIMHAHHKLTKLTQGRLIIFHSMKHCIWRIIIFFVIYSKMIWIIMGGFTFFFEVKPPIIIISNHGVFLFCQSTFLHYYQSKFLLLVGISCILNVLYLIYANLCFWLCSYICLLINLEGFFKYFTFKHGYFLLQ